VIDEPWLDDDESPTANADMLPTHRSRTLALVVLFSLLAIGMGVYWVVGVDGLESKHEPATPHSVAKEPTRATVGSPHDARANVHPQNVQDDSGSQRAPRDTGISEQSPLDSALPRRRPKTQTKKKKKKQRETIDPFAE
jgi:hypothetical protein